MYSAHSRCFEHVACSGLHPGSASSLWSSHEISSATPLLSELQSHQPRLTPECLAEYPDSHLLFFRTSSAHFTTRCNQTSSPSSFADYGNSAPPSVFDPRDGSRVVGRLCRVQGDEIRTGLVTAEFIMVGWRGDLDLPEEVMPRMALVFQVERDQNGIARRVNFGEIELGAWESANPQDCVVALA